MNLPSIFSLIAAALIGLLPILLLAGRRIQQARRRTRLDEGPLESDQDLAEADAGESPAVVMQRMLRGRRPPSVPSAHVPGASDSVTEPVGLQRAVPSVGVSLASRLGRLGEMQRAIVYREVLGPPVALRED